MNFAPSFPTGQQKIFFMQIEWYLPKPLDYPEYYGRYIQRIGEGDLLEKLMIQKDNTVQLFRSMPAEKLQFQYAPGKWTPLQILQHVIDAERIFAFRALCFSRNEQAAIPGFDENTYAEEALMDGRTLDSLLDDFVAVRTATITMIRGFRNEWLNRSGIASEKRISVRSILYVIAGHEFHHYHIIKERYL